MSVRPDVLFPERNKNSLRERERKRLIFKKIGHFSKANNYFRSVCGTLSSETRCLAACVSLYFNASVSVSPNSKHCNAINGALMTRRSV
ncbi:hypothetical protein JOB18_043357 [Solea senegalensis]|uniref:Uncharacterized protein n=1 Tax=Solea senegalensis TaxID=28829 RepID=A0AAV6RQU0_SOLSE|nr:hypothetical protein JOB18_043357 [Solea senegalensis]